MLVKWKIYALQSCGLVYVAINVVSMSPNMHERNEGKNVESIDVTWIKIEEYYHQWD